MRRQIETLVAGYEAGSSTHEELVNQLVALTGGETGRSDTGSTFTSVGINHVALAVSDVDAMAEFMGQHLGTEVIRSSATAGFLACGANNFVGLFKRAEPGHDHLCFTVEGYDPDDALARIEHAGLEAHRTENRVFFPRPRRPALPDC